MTAGLCLDRLKITRPGGFSVALDAHIPPGRIFTLMGPSGSGKSTLLAAIAGTLDPAAELTGAIRLGREDVTRLPPQTRRIGQLFQDDILFPHLSVAGNLLFGLPPDVRGRAARRAAVEAALIEADLPGYGPRDPATLSGGQRARIALMRVLLSRPRALLLDEPFSRLDAPLRARTRAFTFHHARQRALPTLLVTHDPEDAAATDGPVIHLEGTS